MKLKLFVIGIFFAVVNMNAQSVLNASSPEELRKMRKEHITVTALGDTVSTEKEPLPYGFIEERDVLWAKVVWEVIDLNERINQPYYHTSDGLVNDNLSLFQALKNGIESGKITEIYFDEFFKDKMTKDQALSSLSRIDTTDWYYEQKEQGIDMSTVEDNGISKYDIYSQDIKMMKIKGMWYIDKRMGEMRYRLLGISMMGPDALTVGRDFEGADDLIDLFWVWYPDARKELHNYDVFNPNNSASQITYDDMLNARRFNSLIYKSNDVLGDKSIEEFLPEDARAQLEESFRIKNNILQHENDMWNY